jgi:hypothetical protein
MILIAAFAVRTNESDSTYASMPFYSSPYAANLAIVGVFVLQGLCYWLFKWATDLKF